MSLPELVAHRGFQLHYPENTLIAVEAALRAGARFVEIDIQLSRDGVPVLFHDEDLMRMCNVAGAVKDFTAEELKHFRASEYNRFGYRYARTQIATLSELVSLLAHHPNVTVFVELKTESLTHFGIGPMLAAVRGALRGFENRAVLISYALDALLEARRGGWSALGVVLERWGDRRLPVLAEINPAYAFADVNDLPRFGRLRVGDARLVVFEVDDPDVARRLHRRGVHMIETFAIGEMRRALYSGAAI